MEGEVINPLTNAPLPVNLWTKDDHDTLIAIRTLLELVRADQQADKIAGARREERLRTLEEFKAAAPTVFVAATGPIIEGVHKRIDDNAAAIRDLAHAFELESSQRRWLGSLWTKLSAAVVCVVTILSGLLSALHTLGYIH